MPRDLVGRHELGQAPSTVNLLVNVPTPLKKHVFIEKNLSESGRSILKDMSSWWPLDSSWPNGIIFHQPTRWAPTSYK